MKKILFFITFLITFLISYYYFTIYKTNSEKEKYKIEITKIYYAQIGAYKNEDNVSKVTKNLKNYVVEKIDNIYHIYVGVSFYKENILKIKEIYTKNGNNIYVREDLMSNENLFNSINKYDELILTTNDTNTIIQIEKEILNKYGEIQI